MAIKITCADKEAIISKINSIFEHAEHLERFKITFQGSKEEFATITYEIEEVIVPDV